MPFNASSPIWQCRRCSCLWKSSSTPIHWRSLLYACLTVTIVDSPDGGKGVAMVKGMQGEKVNTRSSWCCCNEIFTVEVIFIFCFFFIDRNSITASFAQPPLDLRIWLSFLVMQMTSLFVGFILLGQHTLVVPSRWMSFMKPIVSKDVSVMVPAKWSKPLQCLLPAKQLERV